MKYLFIVSRAASFLIDYMIFYILYYFLASFGILGYILLLIIFFLYRTLSTTFFGETIGMMALKLKLIKHDFKTCLKREILRCASAFFYIGYIYALFDYKGRTLHDAASDTLVVYKDSKSDVVQTKNYIKTAAFIILIISCIRWISFFLLNDVGLLGLKKVYSSDVYYQSFEGDKLLSLSQDELYMKTLGRKYTTLIEKGGKNYLIRISNKIKYTEVYKLNIERNYLYGEYIYTVNLPLQFICSGKFIKSKDLCGVSPTGRIVLVDENGKIYGNSDIKISNVISLKCGDIDKDGFDEALILGKDGNVEIFKMKGNSLKRIYFGKFGEDITPITLYIERYAKVMGKGDDKSIIYTYEFVNGKFKFLDKKYVNIENATNIKKFKNSIIVSHINRNNMTFNRGSIQNLEIYNLNGKMKRLYNFGKRPGRRYNFSVKCLEDVCDIDNDGFEEIILKSVDKKDVMGQKYKIEVYRPVKRLLYINMILTMIEGILY
ncbi:MAG: RDD family protein [Caloramator sp.]|nr:RDD family protein [Caloramator sp.]